MQQRHVEVIRIDALWLCTKPVDMRYGAERPLAYVVHTVSTANAHHGYVFANVQATRTKMLMHDGFGVWCVARRLSVGRFGRSCKIQRVQADRADAGAGAVCRAGNQPALVALAQDKCCRAPVKVEPAHSLDPLLGRCVDSASSSDSALGGSS